MDQEWERKVFVLLLDEQDSFLRAATDFLQREDELKVVGTAFGEAEALVQAQNLRPRVVLLDPSLTDGGGLEIIRHWRNLLPDARIIVLTLMDSSTYRLASLAAGADDFVSKATMVTDLLPAIRRVIEAGLPTDCLVRKIPTSMTISQRNWWPRSLAGKPLAGFRATPDRRIIVLFGMIMSVIRFKNPQLHRQSSLRKRRLGENRGFRPSF